MTKNDEYLDQLWRLIYRARGWARIIETIPVDNDEDLDHLKLRALRAAIYRETDRLKQSLPERDIPF